MMWSTKAASAAKRAWLTLETDLSRRGGQWMVSTDGSSSGWHSAVVVPPAAGGRDGADGAARAETQLRLRARWGDHGGSRNVGAEGMGFLLGIESLPTGIERATCLADFLNALAFDAGTANYKHPVLVDVYGRVDREKAERFPRGLALERIHHPGHQTDDSFFTRLNRAADHLASLGRDVDVRVDVESLEELAAGPKSFSACLERAENDAAAARSGELTLNSRDVTSAL